MGANFTPEQNETLHKCGILDQDNWTTSTLHLAEYVLKLEERLRTLEDRVHKDVEGFYD